MALRSWGVAVAVALLAPSLATADGKDLFSKACATCHSVESAGIRARIKTGGDLGGLSGRLTAEAMIELVGGGSRHPAFNGTDEDLQMLVDWLLQQPAN